MPFGSPPGRVGRVVGMLDTEVGSVLVEIGDSRGGSICGEAVGVKSEGRGVALPTGVSKPVNFGRAGRFAKTEIGCWFFSGDGGRAGRLNNGGGGGCCFSGDEGCVGVISCRRLATLVSSSLNFDTKSRFCRFNSSISRSLSIELCSSCCFSLTRPSIFEIR